MSRRSHRDVKQLSKNGSRATSLSRCLDKSLQYCFAGFFGEKLSKTFECAASRREYKTRAVRIKEFRMRRAWTRRNNYISVESESNNSKSKRGGKACFPKQVSG